MGARILITLAMLASAAPAWAGDPASVPEGSQVTLFALGLLGVIVGRRASSRSKRRDPD
jgi:hypothetical protein